MLNEIIPFFFSFSFVFKFEFENALKFSKMKVLKHRNGKLWRELMT